MSNSGPRADGPTPRRSFTPAQKLGYLDAYQRACDDGTGGGAYLRAEGLYSSQITEWRKLRDAGVLEGKKPGEKILLKLQRGTMLIEKEIVLGDLGSNGVARQSKRDDRMNAMGSTVSSRRGEFPSVIQTDFPLDASQCGGPVTDLDGNVVGMVIARSGRIETLVLPSETIIGALKDVDFSVTR